MEEKIDKSLFGLLIDVEKLFPLEGNPRKGNVDAIVASYKEFGQLRPIVVRDNGNDTFTVIAGNHQLRAAKKLGWKKIAAVIFDSSQEEAVAFALADNRTTELGHTDPQLLNEMITEVVMDYSDLFNDLGWDEFELASLDVQTERLDAITSGGYVAPVIVNPESAPIQNIAIETTDSGSRIVPSIEADPRSVVATGSTSINASGSSRAVVQYTLVFDDPEQQGKWYQFIRWLRTDPGTDGDTTAQRLLNFIDAHCNY
jgi:regulator of extracellular matrix RemA (YlzA/DUF370 family)